MQKTLIIIPCYNEEKRLPSEAFTNFISEQEDVDFCFVNDGSTDGTLNLLQKLQSTSPSRIHVCDLKKNGGKAEAVRQGMLYALKDDNYAFAGFFDADLATPLFEIKRLLEFIDLDPAYLASFCSRLKRMGAIVERKAARHYLGRIFSTFAGIILKMPVYDTQCGAKLFRKGIIEVAFGKPFITKWLFDLEVFMRIRNHLNLETALGSMIEVPVLQWCEKGGSKLSFTHMLKVPLELWKIHSRYNQKKKASLPV